MGFLEGLRSKAVVHRDTTVVTTGGDTSDSEPSVIHDGDLAFTKVQGGNGAGQTYQEAVGAPVETNSPLSYHVGPITIIFLNVNQMIGTGIFSTPGSVLRSTGSVGLALIYWLIGFIMAIAGFSTYLELASYFPSRSGSQVVYLEQAYPRPKYLMAVTYAVQVVVLSFSSSNAIVLSRYLWRLAQIEPSDWQMKGVAVAAYSFAVICVIINNKYSLWATNIIGVLKIIMLVFISITGFVVLGGNVSSIPDPNRNFRNAFEGTTNSGNGLANALVSIIFSYTGYENAFNVVAEIKNPIPQVKKHGSISVIIVAILYMLCNIAYFAAVDKDIFADSGETAASYFFDAVFGSKSASQALNFLVLLSAFGNLLAVLIGQSRVIREVGRQGMLPFVPFWVSTKPFGTPIGPYLLKWGFTVLMILAVPAGDAFTFVVSLQTYPAAVFFTLMSAGVYIIRRRRKRNGLPPPQFRAWDVAVIFFILIQVYTLVMPLIPPSGGIYKGDVSFFYATYCIVGVAILLLCVFYYYVWIVAIPKWKGFTYRTLILEVDDNGASTHRLVKVPNPELEKWDEEHDEAGFLRRRRVGSSDNGHVQAVSGGKTFEVVDKSDP